MEKDSHYYVMYFLCLAAGLDVDESYEIAYCSQFVDDSADGYKKKLIEKDKKEPTYFFDPIRSAYNGLESVVVEVQEKIYYPFHFLPGLQGDCFVDMMVTQPGKDGKLFDELVQEALVSRNRFRIGISLHVLADTYAHSGFSGMWSWSNYVSRVNYIPQGESWFRNVFGKIRWHYHRALFAAAPPIGHSNAFTFPDDPSLNWKYLDYSNELITISNNIKFANAFLDLYEMVIGKYAAQHHKTPRLGLTHQRDNEELREIIWEGVNFHGSLKKRCENWKTIIRKFITDYNDTKKGKNNPLNVPDHHLNYDKKSWEQDVFYKSILGHPQTRKLKIPLDEFKASPYYQFHEAAKDHRAFVLDLVKKPEAVGVRAIDDAVLADIAANPGADMNASIYTVDPLRGGKSKKPRKAVQIQAPQPKARELTPRMISRGTIEKTKEKIILAPIS